MPNYFHDCKTQEQAKAKFRQYAKVLHPDHGGSDADMSDLKKQYDDFKPGENNRQHNYSAGSRPHTPYGHPGSSGYHTTGGAGYNSGDKQFNSNTFLFKGSPGRPGSSFQDRMNSNPFNNSGLHGIPFDHPIHGVICNLKETIRKLEIDLHKTEMSRIYLEDDLRTQISQLLKEKEFHTSIISNLRDQNNNIHQQLQIYESILQSTQPSKSWWRKFFE